MTSEHLTRPVSHRYKRHRFPAEIITHAVWLYFRFPLSLRHVEDLLAERGVEVSFQTVSEWATKFGRDFVGHIRAQSRGGFADKWHLDENASALFQAMAQSPICFTCAATGCALQTTANVVLPPWPSGVKSHCGVRRDHGHIPTPIRPDQVKATLPARYQSGVSFHAERENGVISCPPSTNSRSPRIVQASGP